MKKNLKGIVIIVLCIVFFSSIALILQIVMSYRETDALYEESAAAFTSVNSGDLAEAGGEAEEKADTVPITVDFDALKSVNEEVVGWIYCEGTTINYPVLQGEDDDYYLKHTYDRTENRAGSIFVEALNAPKFADSNTIIYGHHMKNGSMFATLKNWADQEYFEEHPVFWLLTPEQNYRIELISGYITPAVSDTYKVFQGPSQEFTEYLEEAYAKSDFKSDAEWSPNDRFVVLSTCEYVYKDARYVLHGVLVPVDGE